MLALTQSFAQRAPNDVDRLIELGRAEIAAGQRAEASATINRAFALGASDATLAAHGLVRKPTPTSPLLTFATGLGIAIGVIVPLVCVLLTIGQIQTKRTLAWLEQPIGDDVTGEHKNRYAYRVIVRLAGVLYTLMLPVIVVVGLVVGIGFVLLMLAGRRLAFGEVQGTILGFAKTVKVLVLRGWHRLFPKTVPETSRLITTDEAPALFAALERVSAIVDTPPPDEVRMVPQAWYQFTNGSRRAVPSVYLRLARPPWPISSSRVFSPCSLMSSGIFVVATRGPVGRRPG
jgi:hypothetical protein